MSPSLAGKVLRKIYHPGRQKMKKLTVMTIIASVVAGFVLSSAASAQAFDILNPQLQVQAKKRAAKHKAAGNKTSFSSGSQETTKERNARLKRECQGGVNAGACAGFTR
jgi:hypothetical protein